MPLISYSQGLLEPLWIAKPRDRASPLLKDATFLLYNANHKLADLLLLRRGCCCRGAKFGNSTRKNKRLQHFRPPVSSRVRQHNFDLNLPCLFPLSLNQNFPSSADLLAYTLFQNVCESAGCEHAQFRPPAFQENVGLASPGPHCSGWPSRPRTVRRIWRNRDGTDLA